MTNDLLSLLRAELATLESATEILQHSYELCKKLVLKNNPPLMKWTVSRPLRADLQD